jgi:hypothetical protein
MPGGLALTARFAPPYNLPPTPIHFRHATEGILVRIAAILGVVSLLTVAGVYTCGAVDSEPLMPPTKPRIPAHLPESVHITRTADVATLRSHGERSYAIDCLIHWDAPPADADYSPKMNVITRVPCPRFSICDGEHITLADTSIERRQIAEIAESGTRTPIMREFKVGTTFEATVVDLGNDAALLDLTASWSGKSAIPHDDQDAVKLTATEGRIIQRVTLGQKVVARFDGWSIEATILDGNEK